MTMETILNFPNLFREWDERNSDQSLSELPFSDSPKVVILIIATYLVSIKVGPKLMKNRPPMKLKTFMEYYNLFQIVTCCAIVLLTLTTDRPLLCSKIIRSSVPKYDRYSFIAYYNFISRITEFIDTVLFILRKKEQQLTFLHIYHHCYNLALAWLAQRYKPGGTTMLVIGLNFFVHFVMYSYYYSTASTSPTLQKIAKSIKKYLTQMQMVQFIYLIAMGLGDLYKPECGPVDIVNWTGLFHLTFLFCLFMNFYIKTYITNKSKSV